MGLKIGKLNNGATKSMLLGELFRLTKVLTECVDDDEGYAWYRGYIFDYKGNVFLHLLGSDVQGKIRVVEIGYTEKGFTKPLKWCVDEKGVHQAIERFLDKMPSIPNAVISKIVFDFNEKPDISATQVYLFEDLSDSPDSLYLMVETDRHMVDTYMLKSRSHICKGTLLCEDFFEVYRSLHNMRFSDEEKQWFKNRGVVIP